jgi:pimeloyl-ACP methyl ester carboxylesterase
VHYEVLGRGRPIIFLHGWLGSWRYWIPSMQAASTTYRAYALDFWGYGETAKEPDVYSLEKQTDLLEKFLGEMGIQKVALVGHGLGGLVAVQFANCFESMVDRMMLVDCPLGPESINPRLLSSTQADLANWLLDGQPAGSAARVDSLKADANVIQKSLNIIESANIGTVLQAGLKTPCLLAYGQNDPVIVVPNGEVQFAAAYYVHQITLDQCGHFPMLDDPARFQRLLLDFLALESGASPGELQMKEEWKRRVR